MKARLLFLYGLAVYASGFGRVFFFPGGEKGLYYGLVMGTLALLGSFFLSKGHVLRGAVLGGLAIAFTGGWYAWECFVIQGFADAEWRQLIMIGVSLLVAVLLTKKGGADKSDEIRVG